MAAPLSQIVPAVFVFFLIGIFLVLGFVVNGKLPQWGESAKKQLSKNHIDLLPDGRVKLGVENISHEEYMDKMQKAFVGAVNNSHANLPSKRSTIPRWKNQNEDMGDGNVPTDRTSTF
ncbi:hypothetical protein L873DRAFT_1813398 [Choiromyces venosus 120613-1]|uniref:Uncharacterized protein n=1 Tax=Choiromyces venosus 120613-1 TaxID=1336337 RepID=A0A3N4J9Y2_9PEZI|nr:hypothetical protein L873DRAFT_1813398 [Choiromyces venosus 120613-1]